MGRDLRDAVAVVTGASSGTGAATALALAEAGATVVLVARRADALERVAERCRALGADATAAPADVTDGEALEAVARDTVARHGRVDLWVHAAGVTLVGRTEEVPAGLWRRTVDVDLVGAFHSAQAALPWFREQGAGVLVLITPALGGLTPAQQSAAVASALGVRGLADCLRHETADADGVHVVTVVSGPVDTPLLDHAANHSGLHPVPPVPPLDPREVAAAVVSVARRPRGPGGLRARDEVVVGPGGAGAGSREVDPAATADRALLRRPTPATDGTLWEPRAETGGRLDGGWRDGDRPDGVRPTWVVPGGVVAAGVAAAGTPGRGPGRLAAALAVVSAAVGIAAAARGRRR